MGDPDPDKLTPDEPFADVDEELNPSIVPPADG